MSICGTPEGGITAAICGRTRRKTNFLNSQNEMDATDFAIIDILNNVTSIEDFF